MFLKITNYFHIIYKSKKYNTDTKNQTNNANIFITHKT